MKRIIIKWVPARNKRIYVVQSRRWCFLPWKTEGSYIKRDKAVDAYLEDNLKAKAPNRNAIKKDGRND